MFPSAAIHDSVRRSHAVAPERSKQGAVATRVWRPLLVLVLAAAPLAGCETKPSMTPRECEEWLIGKWSAHGELDEERLNNSPAGKFLGTTIREFFSEGVEKLHYRADGTMSIWERLTPDEVDVCKWRIKSVDGSIITVELYGDDYSGPMVINFEGPDTYWTPPANKDPRIRRLVYQRQPDDVDFETMIAEPQRASASSSAEPAGDQNGIER